MDVVKLGLTIVCAGTVTFLFWVLMSLLKEWIDVLRDAGWGQKPAPKGIRTKYELIIPIDLRQKSFGAAMPPGTPQQRADSHNVKTSMRRA